MEVKNEVVLLKRNMENKIKMAPDLIKEFYSGLRNELSSYISVNERMMVACDQYKVKKTVIAKITLAGKVMKLYLPLNVNDYEQSKFHQNDVSEKKAYKDLPFMVKVNSKLGLKKAILLIGDVAKKFELVKASEYTNVDYVSMYPYVQNGEFEKSASRKKVTKEETVEEEILSTSESLVQPQVEEIEDVVTPQNMMSNEKQYATVPNKYVSKRLASAIVNLALLDKNFNEGEVVNLEALKAKGLINRNARFLKVLGTGNLSKNLEVCADHYSKSALSKLNK